MGAIYLLIAPPGSGKSHWLAGIQADARVDCTLLPHRSILLAIADQLGITDIPNRATIADILALIADHRPPAAIALDNADRAPHKLCYSIIALADTPHTIYITATERRRLRPILDRGIASLVPPPPVDIPAILAERYPDLSPAIRRRIAATAANPAAALQMAAAIRAGAPPPTQPAQSIAPLVIILVLGLTYLIRREAELSPIWIALIAAGGYALRRYFWRATTR